MNRENNLYTIGISTNAYISCFHIDQASESSIDSNQRSLFRQTSRASFHVLLTSNIVNTSLWLAHWGKDSDMAVTEICLSITSSFFFRIKHYLYNNDREQLLLCYMYLKFVHLSVFIWKSLKIFTSHDVFKWCIRIELSELYSPTQNQTKLMP